MKRLLPLLFIAAFLYQCGSTHDYTWKSKNTAKPVLPLDSIYDWNKGRQFSENNTPANRKEGSKLFLHAIDLYRNKKDAISGVAFFKESLTYYPNSRTYYELGNALLDTKVPDEALKAYNLAIGLDYKPEYNVYYNIACANAMKGDTVDALDNLTQALENGYNNKKHFLEDKDLDILRQSEHFKILQVKYFSGQEMGKKQIFTMLRSGFPKKGLPFSILDNPENAYDPKKVISYDYQDFIPGMTESGFGREVTDEYSYTANLLQTDSMTLLAFTSMNMMADTLDPVSTMIASYNAEGKIIDSLEFACRCSPIMHKTGTMDANQNLEIKEYRNTWDFDPISKGYKNNTILKTELVRTEHYVFDKTGHFKKVEAGDNFVSKP